MMKIALAQMTVVPGHPDVNTEKILSMIENADSDGADLIIFPEMAVPGYLLGDTWEAASFIDDCVSCNDTIIKATKDRDIAVMFGTVAVETSKKNKDGRIRKYNALFTAQHGDFVWPSKMPLPFMIKTLMPNYREFDDSRHFFSLISLADEMGVNPNDIISPVTIKTVSGEEYTVGGMLCEDGWSENYSMAPIDALEKSSPDLIVNISSSPFTLGKNEKRHKVFSALAKKAKAPLIYVNNVGIQNNGKTIYTFDGRSTVYDVDGGASLTMNAYDDALHYICVSRDESGAIKIERNAKNDCATAQSVTTAGGKNETAEIYDALRYGIRHFLDSIQMKKVVVGISGGIDSAVTAALYADVIGKDNVLLVNMPSVYNSETTKGLAARLAQNLGCRYAVMPIQEAVNLTINEIETTPIENLATGESEHLAVSSFVAENIQARDRSSRVLAAAAAAFGGGFTCNANKAETTVGYSTLYGDQSGFLAALADLWKYQVYDLARFLNDDVYHREVIPQETIDIVPSAELSTAQDVDKGLGDPLRYPYHDALFRSFIERWNKATPEDILVWYQLGILEEKIGCEKGLVKKYFPTLKSFIDDLEHWWNRFTGLAVAKRIQSPPILAVSRRAYGFDHRESQNGPYYTTKYRTLKKLLLEGENR